MRLGESALRRAVDPCTLDKRHSILAIGGNLLRRSIGSQGLLLDAVHSFFPTATIKCLYSRLYSHEWWGTVGMPVHACTRAKKLTSTESVHNYSRGGHLGGGGESILTRFHAHEIPMDSRQLQKNVRFDA